MWDLEVFVYPSYMIKPAKKQAKGTQDNEISYIISILSSPTLANTFSCVEFQSTSLGYVSSFHLKEAGLLTPTTEVWPLKILVGSMVLFALVYELTSLEQV